MDARACHAPVVRAARFRGTVLMCKCVTQSNEVAGFQSDSAPINRKVVDKLGN